MTREEIDDPKTPITALKAEDRKPTEEKATEVEKKSHLGDPDPGAAALYG